MKDCSQVLPEMQLLILIFDIVAFPKTRRNLSVATYFHVRSSDDKLNMTGHY